MRKRKTDDKIGGKTRVKDTTPKRKTQPAKARKLRAIMLEEHFGTRAFMEGPGGYLKDRAQAANATPQVIAQVNKFIDRVCDIGTGRIADMDAAGVDVQALSLITPGVEQLAGNKAVELAREVNDRVAEAMRRYPGRFVGLASLPTAIPEKAAQELERVVSKHGFKGAVINGHNRGRYLDDGFFWGILECAEALGVPIYLHPTLPPKAVIDASYTGNFSPQVTSALARTAWGWHIETAVHLLRLIVSGAFDRYQNLQIIIGHMGEALPFMLPRIDESLPGELTKLNYPVSHYLRQNVYYTFGGFNYTQCFLNLLLEVGSDRIVLSADYPYKTMEEPMAFLDQLPISPMDKERIAHINAERLLKI
jgi:predicted TIM-barrel fold metal-dependent hydrolase